MPWGSPTSRRCGETDAILSDWAGDHLITRFTANVQTKGWGRVLGLLPAVQWSRCCENAFPGRVPLQVPQSRKGRRRRRSGSRSGLVLAEGSRGRSVYNRIRTALASRDKGTKEIRFGRNAVPGGALARVWPRRSGRSAAAPGACACARQVEAHRRRPHLQSVPLALDRARPGATRAISRRRRKDGGVSP